MPTFRYSATVAGTIISPTQKDAEEVIRRALRREALHLQELAVLMRCGHDAGAVAGDGATHWCAECAREAE